MKSAANPKQKENTTEGLEENLIDLATAAFSAVPNPINPIRLIEKKLTQVERYSKNVGDSLTPRIRALSV